MATILESEQHVQRFVLPRVTWEAYEQFLTALGDRPGLRLNYDGRNLEFMTISPLHEFIKRIVGQLIDMLCFELNIPKKSGGSFTFKREDVERGAWSRTSVTGSRMRRWFAGRATSISQYTPSLISRSRSRSRGACWTA